MYPKIKAAMAVSALLCLGFVSSAVLAGGTVIDSDMTRRPAGSISGDKVSTVEANCPADPGGNAWQDAEAELEIKQKGSTSKVEIELKHAVPDTVFTVWLRIKGKNGLNKAGSPLTGGGATPLAPGTALDSLNDNSPWGANSGGSATVANAFTTNHHGKGKFKIKLDFPVVGGAYPFQKTATSRPGFEDLPNVPTAIANPADAGQGSAPFLIRVVSHCTDGVGHGLSPGTREAWFQYP